MLLGKLDSYSPKNETGPLSYIILKNKAKWIKDLNIRCEAIECLEENLGSKLFDMGLSNIFFLHLSPQGRATKAKISE